MHIVFNKYLLNERMNTHAITLGWEQVNSKNRLRNDLTLGLQEVKMTNNLICPFYNGK